MNRSPTKPVRFLQSAVSPAVRFCVGYALAGILWFSACSQFPRLLGFGPEEDDLFLDIIVGDLFVGATALLLYFQFRYKLDERKQNRPAPIRENQLSGPSLLAVALILLSMVAIGITLYLLVKQQVAVSTTANLESISRLKVTQIQTWLDEARSDANLTIESHSFKAELQTWLDNGKRDDKFRDYLQTRLIELVAMGHYRHASLFDRSGILLMTTAKSGDPAVSGKRVLDTIRQARPIFYDVHIDTTANTKELSLGFLLPITIDRGPQIDAVLYIALSPDTGLYPALQQWPGTSPSAETVLVRRDGNDVVFLNTLRHRNDAPLTLRMPITTPNLLAAQALNGQSGGFAGLDYRKHAALAYSIPVPGTSWRLLSKIDEDEVDATLNALAKLAVAMVTIQLLVAGFWMNNYYRAMNARNRAQAEHLQLANRMEILVRNANDCIIILDENYRIIEVNDQCLGTYGYSREEMLGMSGDALFENPNDKPNQIIRGQKETNGRQRYVANHRRKNLSVFPVEISLVSMTIDGVFRTQKIIRDISEREQSDARIMRLSQLYATLSSVNQAIARSKDIKSVFHTACSSCVEHGGLLYAWIGLSDPEGENLTAAYSYGANLDPLEGVNFRVSASSAEGHGPTGTAFRQLRVYVCNDYARDPVVLPWREQAARYGIRSSISLPISRGGKTVATLTAYSDKVNFFDAMVEHLLKEIADGLSFAMYHFAEEEAKQKVENELRKSEELLHEAQEIARIGHWQYDLRSEAGYWSPQMYRLFGRDPSSGPADAHEIGHYYSPESARLLNSGISRAIASRKRIELELQVNQAHVHVAYQAIVLIPIRDDQGKVVLIRGTAQDITERKLNEQKLKHVNQVVLEFAQEVEDLYQNAPCGYHSLDADGVIRRINETELKWLGYSRDELIGKNLKDLFVPDFLERFEATFPILIDNGEVRDLEMELISKDGNRLPVLINATSIRDKRGNFRMTRSTLYNMTERKKMEVERLEYSLRIEQLSRRLVSSQESGRRELSAALHDQTSPNLSAIEINLNVIARLLQVDQSPEVAAILDDTFALLKDTTISIREICSELRPSLLDYAGLMPALEGYANQFSRRTGTPVRIRGNESAVRLPPEKESMLFRIVQEAMTNCAKHAAARSIEVALNQSDQSTVLTIADDGIGFIPEQLGKNGKKIGQGVLNMREISEFIGGRFTIDSSPGKGTLISVEISQGEVA